jgi:hypothetical protein
MRSFTIGRILGTGIRAVGRVASQQSATGTQAAPPSASVSRVEQGRAAGQTARRVSHAASQGASGFFRSLLRVGGILWLEMTGSFFLLFAAVFTLRLWQGWKAMGQMRYGVVALTAVFCYLGLSSFWRARQR